MNGLSLSLEPLVPAPAYVGHGGLMDAFLSLVPCASSFNDL